MKVHNIRNKIRRLQNEEGVMIEEYNQVKELSIYFFENLFTDPSPPATLHQDWYGKTPSEAQSLSLCDPIFRKEITEAIFFIKTNSSPGPDGFSTNFYKIN